jgi:hypothetical protein
MPNRFCPLTVPSYLQVRVRSASRQGVHVTPLTRKLTLQERRRRRAWYIIQRGLCCEPSYECPKDPRAKNCKNLKDDGDHRGDSERIVIRESDKEL